MASEEQRGPPGPAPGLGPPPSPPEAGAPAAEPPLTLARPVSPRDPDFRLLLEESAFQALAQELLLKRPRASQDALPPREGEGRRRLPFPKKLWAIVNSARFASVWWASDGTCIGINEKLFQKEVLERDGPDKVFKTDSMKSFVRQLSLYGFSRLRRNAHTSICPTNYFTGGAPVHIQSKVTGQGNGGRAARLGVLGSGGREPRGPPPGHRGPCPRLGTGGRDRQRQHGQSPRDGAKGVGGAFLRDPHDGPHADLS